jgi:hypothetical protein
MTVEKYYKTDDTSIPYMVASADASHPDRPVTPIEGVESGWEGTAFLWKISNDAYFTPPPVDAMPWTSWIVQRSTALGGSANDHRPTVLINFYRNVDGNAESAIDNVTMSASDIDQQLDSVCGGR